MPGVGPVVGPELRHPSVRWDIITDRVLARCHIDLLSAYQPRLPTREPPCRPCSELSCSSITQSMDVNACPLARFWALRRSCQDGSPFWLLANGAHSLNSSQ